MSETIDWRKEFGTGKKDLYYPSSKVSELPTEGIISGSTNYCPDTGDVYVFSEETKSWILQ